MGFPSFNQQENLGTRDDNDYDEEEGLDLFASNSFDDDDDVSSVVSSESGSIEDQEVNSSSSSSEASPENLGGGALSDMSSLVQQLPSKRGLSKHFQGKSQSFTSLSNVLCVEDLAKPENPYNKKLKSCKSYGGLLLLTENSTKNTKNKNKASSKGSCSSLISGGRNNNISFLGNRLPPPHRSTSTNNFSNQTPLFA